MGQRTAVTPPRTPSSNAAQRLAEPPAPPVAPASDLTVSKILAVAGAGATSAVFGSLFGVAGTVLGAAMGSVLITVGTSLYQRSIDRARSAVTSRLRPNEPGPEEPATVIIAPPVHPGDQPTELIAPADVPARSRRRFVGYVLATVIGFAIALGMVTGVEALKGSTLLQGESGTSVGRVLQGGQPASVTPTPDPSDSSSDDDGGSSGKSQYDRNSDDDGATDPTTSSPLTSPPGSSQPSTTGSAEPSGGLGGLIGGGSGGASEGGSG